MTKCCYCGKSWKEVDEACASCGAPNRSAKRDYFYPFFYEGYIVYAIRRYDLDAEEFHFYKGITYFGRVMFTSRERDEYSPAYDVMPVIFEKFTSERVSV
jgi:hypothetical protein